MEPKKIAFTRSGAVAVITVTYYRNFVCTVYNRVFLGFARSLPPYGRLTGVYLVTFLLRCERLRSAQELGRVQPALLRV